MDRTHRRKLGLVLCSVVVAGVVLTGWLSASAQVSGQAKNNSETSVKVSLPTVPPMSELFPEIYDKNGCLRLPEDEGGGSRCPAPAPEPELVDDSPRTYRGLRGFGGPYYATQIDGRSVVLLAESLTVASEGTWSAQGLIRNQKSQEIGNVTVTASLFAGNGTLLDEVAGVVPVTVLRPGEPAPFEIHTSHPVTEVDRVEWAVETGTPNGASRDFLVQPYWQLRYGSRYLLNGADRPDAPYPYVLAAGFRNLGRTVKSAKLVVAWLDESDKVVWMETTSLAPEFPQVYRDGRGNFQKITVTNDQIGPRLSSLTPMFWVVGE